MSFIYNKLHRNKKLFEGVEYILFDNMRSNYSYVSFCGVRFYDNGVIIPSGSELTKNINGGDTTNFSVTCFSMFGGYSYYYNCMYPFSLTRPLNGYNTQYSFWCGVLSSDYSKEFVKCKFKTPVKFQKFIITMQTETDSGIDKMDCTIKYTNGAKNKFTIARSSPLLSSQTVYL